MSAPAPGLCRNCFQPLGTGRPRFCPQCGQETNLRPPTLFEFAQQFGGAIVSTEGALWRTLKLLVLRPGELTRQYLAGRRRHYVLPVRLYLTASVLALLLLRLTATDPSELTVVGGENALRIADKDRIRIDLGGGRGDRTGTGGDTFGCEGAPQWVCDRIGRRFSRDPAQTQRAIAEVSERFKANVGSLMFALLPCFAFLTKLAYWRRDLRYTEHLVFALHLHAFWFVALMLTAPGWWWLSAAAFAWMAVYAIRAMKHVFGGRTWALYLRAASIATLYGLALATGLVLLGIAVALA